MSKLYRMKLEHTFLDVMLWDGTNVEEVTGFLGHRPTIVQETPKGELCLSILESQTTARPGDYVCRKITSMARYNVIVACSAVDFAHFYEEVEVQDQDHAPPSHEDIVPPKVAGWDPTDWNKTFGDGEADREVTPET